MKNLRCQRTKQLYAGRSWHRPIFPGSHPPSIVGTAELNFCVRDGNRWDLSVIYTSHTARCPASPERRFAATLAQRSPAPLDPWLCPLRGPAAFGVGFSIRCALRHISLLGPSDRILNKECLRHHSLPGSSPSSFRPSDQIPDKECPRHSSISSALAL